MSTTPPIPGEAAPHSPPRRTFLARVRRLLQLRRDPARIGDAAVLQSELLGGPMSARARATVDALVAHHCARVLRPRLDFDALQQLPPGTFGRALAEFCAANAIVPAVVSDEFADDELRPMAAVARYIAVHDMFHVLLRCDTSIPEELRITAFILEQGYFRASKFFLAVLRVLGPLVRPHRAAAIVANIRAGRELARRGAMLLGEPLEDFLAEDLTHLQRRLGLAPA